MVKRLLSLSLSFCLIVSQAFAIDGVRIPEKNNVSAIQYNFTDIYRRLTIFNSALSINTATSPYTLGLDHGSISGLTGDDHTQYLLASSATSRTAFASNWTDLTDDGGTTLHTHTYLPLSGGTLTGDTTLNTTKKLNFGDCNLYESSSGVLKVFGGIYNELTVDGANHGTVIRATSKLWLDGASGVGGDTHLSEVSNDTVRLTVGNTPVLDIGTTYLQCDAGIGFAVQPGQKIWPDGGGDTYQTESSANVFDTYVGNTLTLRAVAGDVYSTAYTDYSADSTVVGWSSFTYKVIYYKRIGKLVFVNFRLQGTSDATGVSFTVPYSMVNTTHLYTEIAVLCADNGGTQTWGNGELGYNSATVNIYPTPAQGAWTASGLKYVFGQFVYQTN